MPEPCPSPLPNQGDVTDDVFLGGALRIGQLRDGFRSGADSVLLAAAAPLPEGRSARVLDAGAGAGTVGLCLAARLPKVQVDLLEQEPELVGLCRRNVTSNGLDDRVGVISGDLTALTARDIPGETYDHAVTNPPFYTTDLHRVPADPLRAAARAFAPDGLDGWIAAIARMLKPKGTMTLIYPADSLASVLAAVTPRFGAIRVVPVYARADSSPARRLLVTARKASRAPLVMEPPLVLHGAGNAFLPDVAACLRAPRALAVWTPS